jgi:transcriptional regulator with XRE-family HTH domain
MDERQIGQNIRALRTSRGLSLTEAAKRAGLSKSSLSKIEKAQVSSPIATLLAVASALDVHLSRFFVESEAVPTHVVTRNGKAPVISRGGSEYGYSYQALALEMPEKSAEPFLLTVRP